MIKGVGVAIGNYRFDGITQVDERRISMMSLGVTRKKCRDNNTQQPLTRAELARRRMIARHDGTLEEAFERIECQKKNGLRHQKNYVEPGELLRTVKVIQKEHANSAKQARRRMIAREQNRDTTASAENAADEKTIQAWGAAIQLIEQNSDRPRPTFKDPATNTIKAIIDTINPDIIPEVNCIRGVYAFSDNEFNRTGLDGIANVTPHGTIIGIRASKVPDTRDSYGVGLVIHEIIHAGGLSGDCIEYNKRLRQAISDYVNDTGIQATYLPHEVES